MKLATVNTWNMLDKEAFGMKIYFKSLIVQIMI